MGFPFRGATIQMPHPPNLENQHSANHLFQGKPERVTLTAFSGGHSAQSIALDIC